MATTPDESPLTATGTWLSVVVVLPSWPWALAPKHMTAPVEVTAHVWSAPAETATTADESPFNATGSCERTSDPQHVTVPVAVEACVGAGTAASGIAAGGA